MYFRLLLLSAGLALAFPASLFSGGVAPPGTAEKIQASARQLLDHDDRVEADRLLALVLAQVPRPADQANVYAERGRWCVLAQRFKLAEADFTQALQLDPNCRAVVTYRARIWLDNREYDRVIAALKKEDPGMTNGDEQAILALAFLRRDGPGDKEEGISLADQAWDLGYKDSTFDVEIAAGEAGIARNLVSGSRSHFDKAATFSPHHPDVARNLGIVDDFEASIEGDPYEPVTHAFEKRNYSDAAGYCQSVLDHRPNDPPGLELLGKIYLAWADHLAETNEVAGARQKLALARETGVATVVKQVDDRLQQLREHMLSAAHEGNDTLALTLAEAELKSAPEDVDARQVEITLYTRQHRWPELIQSYQDGLTHLAGNPLSAAYINQWGMGKGVAMVQIERELTSQVENGTPDEKQLGALIEIFHKIAQTDYKSSYNYEVLSDLYTLQGDWQRASTAMYQASQSADPSQKERLEEREKEADAIWRHAPKTGSNVALFRRYHARVDDLIERIRSRTFRPEDVQVEKTLPYEVQSRLHDLDREMNIIWANQNEVSEQIRLGNAAVAKLKQAKADNDDESYTREYNHGREAERLHDQAVQNIQNAEIRFNRLVENFWLE